MPSTMGIENGAQVWRNIAGKLHRDGDKPAVVYSNGTQEWWVNGQRHRDNGLPAIVRADGHQEWWVNDLRHREGGLPAVIWAGGRREWWIHGELVTEEEARRFSPPPPVQGPSRTRFHLIEEW